MDTNGTSQRTEEQKLTQAPLNVTLGGKDYEVKLLSIKASAEWRRKAADAVCAVRDYAGMASDEKTASDGEAFAKSIRGLMSLSQDEVVNLFFAYARDLPRDIIENEANEQELAVAFDQVVEVAFPLGRSLTSLGGMGRRQVDIAEGAKPSPLAARSSSSCRSGS